MRYVSKVPEEKKLKKKLQHRELNPDCPRAKRKCYQLCHGGFYLFSATNA